MDIAAASAARARMPLFVRTVADSFVFAGRSTRTEALGFVLVSTLLSQTALVLAGDRSEMAWVAVALALALTLEIPGIALFVRRMHEQDRSGWWALIGVAKIPLALALMSMPGDANGVSIVRMLIWEGRYDWDAGTWPLLLAVTLLVIAQLGFYFAPGTDGANRYGADPRVER
jgi:uncharacterized membrane protein YhaH (DUF805 family)